MIKVRKGQTWRSKVGSFFTIGKEYNILESKQGKYFTIKDDSSKDGHMARCCWINENFEFIPQNDLEWLAVNIEKFPTAIFNYLFWDAENIKHGIENTTYQQWQNMRYHLGQDKKPRYRLTGGEWVKQC